MMKPMLIPYINENRDGIRFGGSQTNIAREITCDDAEYLYNLLLSINGKSSITELSQTHAIPQKELLSILKTLKESGVIYENDATKVNFSADELIYYSRNLNFFAWIDSDALYYNYWKVQEKLKNSNVLLLGAGGTGSNCAESLARMGIGNITIIDTDMIETSNLNRQCYSISDIGKYKSLVLKKHLNSINPYIKVKNVNMYIENISSLNTLEETFDIIINCIDKPDNIKSIVASYAEYKNIPWILGGYASTIINNAIFTPTSKSYDDVLTENHFSDYNARMVRENNIWNWDNAIISPIAAISGNISALYTMYYLTKIKYLEYSKIQHLDFYNFQDLHNFFYIAGDNNA